jgi:DNA anti-recombination protein RmuC
MDNPKGRATPNDPKKPEQPAASAAQIEAVVKPFRDSSNTYWRALQDVQGAGHQSYEEAHRSYLNAIRGLNDDLQKRYSELGADYTKKLREALEQQDAQMRCAEIQREFASSLRDIQESAQKRFEQVYSDFAGALQQAVKEAKSSFQEAYRSYLRSQQETWSRLDINAITGSH